MPEFTRVGSVDEFQPGAIKAVKLDGEEVAVVQANGRFYAFADYCTHLGGALSSGYVSGEEVVCIVHYAAFNMENGAPTDGPAAVGLSLYAVKVEGDAVYVSKG